MERTRWQRFLRALRLQRWPVLDPKEIEQAEIKKKLDRIFLR